jgi:hypothetical protein
MSEINPRSITDEGPFIPASLADVIDLRQRVLDAGHSESVANGVVGFVVAKAAGEATPLTDVTRSRYRRILRELGEDGPDGGRAVERPGPTPVAGNGGKAKKVPKRKPRPQAPARPAAARSTRKPQGDRNTGSAHNPQFRYLRLIPGDLGAVEGDEGRKAA